MIGFTKEQLQEMVSDGVAGRLDATLTKAQAKREAAALNFYEATKRREI